MKGKCLKHKKCIFEIHEQIVPTFIAHGATVASSHDSNSATHSTTAEAIVAVVGSGSTTECAASTTHSASRHAATKSWIVKSSTHLVQTATEDLNVPAHFIIQD